MAVRAAILNHMVDIAHFLLGPHVHIRSSFWWCSQTQTEALKNLLHLRLCMFTFVFLYAIIPTTWLNTCWHSDPYIFWKMFFVMFLWIFFLSLIFSEDRQLHAAAANAELGWIRLASAACSVNNYRSTTCTCSSHGTGSATYLNYHVTSRRWN